MHHVVRFTGLNNVLQVLPVGLSKTPLSSRFYLNLVQFSVCFSMRNEYLMTDALFYIFEAFMATFSQVR